MKLSTAILVAAFVLFPGIVLAADKYYVELAHEMGEADAKAEWDKLSKENKDLLGNLQYFPETVLRRDNTVVTRIHAGPVGKKSKAESLCAKLFKKKVPCFVVEGVDHSINVGAAPGETQQRPFADIRLPWGGAPDAAMTPVASSERKPINKDREGILPWLYDGKHTGEEPPAAPVVLSAPKESAPAAMLAPLPPPPVSTATAETVPAPAPITITDNTPKKPNAKATVEVAEAIRVPLTESEPAPIARAVPPDAPVRPLPPEDAGANRLSLPSGSGWLNIESFADEIIAGDFWQRVREAIPEQSVGLRVQTIKPALQQNSTVALNIGPFPSRDDAMAFCRDGVTALVASLRCRFDRDEPKAVSKLFTPPKTHGNAYEARRQKIASSRRAATSSGTAPAVSSGYSSTISGKVYWVEVASALTQVEALQTWEKLREDNADVLEGLRSSVSAPLSHDSAYVVRVGPLNDRDKALNLCNTLKDRGLSCRIYSNM